jgi:predicted TIM-barrel fold metal-dependent hydrolase
MLRIDADAHVYETEATWEYMTAAEAQHKPICFDPPDGRPVVPGDRRPHRFWMVDGRVDLRRWCTDERTGTTLETRELLDVAARVRHMDQLGIETQVLYPTYLLQAPSDNPDVELAMYRSYNRWLADKTAESNGRLRWVVMPPLRSMDRALEELRYGREHGAVGVFKRAVECGGKGVYDRYFSPLYEEAMRLDLPICIHVGGENFSHTAAAGGKLGLSVNPAIGCFAGLAMSGATDRFPTLRFAVIEAMASWVPYVIADLKAKDRYSGVNKVYAEHPFNLNDDFLRANRFYVTCQTSDDVPYLMKFGAEDNLMIGTDYGHDDQSGVIGALGFIEQLGRDGELSAEAVRKILCDNPRTFYSL